MPGHEQYRGKLAIPYVVGDHVVQMRFRCIQDHNCREQGHGKYLTVAGEPARMFNVPAIHRAKAEIHVCEGEFDAMILSQIGEQAVAIPGANNWANHHRRMLAGFSRVHVWADPDSAGAEFVNRVCRALRSARGVRLRDGDVNETFLKGGTSAIYDLIDRRAA